MEKIQSILDLVALGEAVWAIVGAAITTLGWIVFGSRYKQRIAALENRPSVVVNMERSGRLQGHPPNFDPVAAVPTIPFADLGPRIAVFASGEEWSHADIWALHTMLGEHGIPWPGPGITPPFRRAISKELLSACQEGDLNRARTAWATVKGQLRNKSSS